MTADHWSKGASQAVAHLGDAVRASAPQSMEGVRNLRYTLRSRMRGNQYIANMLTTKIRTSSGKRAISFDDPKFTALHTAQAQLSAERTLLAQHLKELNRMHATPNAQNILEGMRQAVGAASRLRYRHPVVGGAVILGGGIVLPICWLYRDLGGLSSPETRD